MTFGYRFTLPVKHIAATVTVISMAGLLYALASAVPWWSADQIVVKIADTGQWGPVILMLIMAAAVVFSPIPSAPITLAAGAVYGHLWGTIYALAGAEIGALIAFELARRFGRERIGRWIGTISLPRTVNSQVGLTTVVFIARLLPAVSFDVISYAAGLTRLDRSWFALATAAGMIPATFLLSHTGAGLRAIEDDGMDILFSLTGLGLLSGIGIIFGLWRTRAGSPETYAQTLEENSIK
ncbi:MULTISPECIES: TVP38/TMEM64 family protein [Nisaea]|uniref:TVP38/TMEM64 family protein n=1 Tax=Nisaea TaxID=390876 RepID=UPI0003FBF877|nr:MULTISPECIES: TVP38/TMEM64 family protein [Nisaea]